MVATPGTIAAWWENVRATVLRKQATVPRPLESSASDPLPLVVEDITPAWVSKILHVKVETLKVREVIHGSGSKVLIEVAYAKSKNVPPTHLCVKGGFNPPLLELLPSLFAVYRLEAQFYHDIAPQIPGLLLLPAYWCGVDHPSGKGQGIVVLQDAKAAGYTFGDPLQTWSGVRVRGALAQLACLHAATWGAAQAALPWVPRALGMRDVVRGMMSAERWAARLADPAVRPPGVPAALWGDRARVVRCLETLWRTAAAARMVCVVHGDTQVGNTFVDGDGRPGFLDWQCVHVNSAAHDVAYFLTGALTVEERREQERALFGFYLYELHQAGGPHFEMEDVWDEYRKYQMQGFVWALADPMMQPKEIVDVMSQRHCAAILDHRSLELLESLEGTH